MSKCFLICFFLFSFGAEAQKSAWAKLGTAEKVWVILHPFSAKKAYKISQQTLRTLDSLESTYPFAIAQSGSKYDALRHGYWMSLLSSRIGYKRALWLGKAHEKKNKKDFEKGRLEDGLLPDSVAIEMDLFNNCVGAEYGRGCKNCSDNKLLENLINALKNGELVFIKQNEEGQFLDAEGNIIPLVEWNGKWKNRRVLVSTSSKH